jgi:serine protease Do
MRNSVANTLPGTRVNLEVLRNGNTQALTATVGELEASRVAASAPTGERGAGGRFGLSVEPGDEGLTVVDLDPTGVAAESGLQEGDVIQKVDGRAVKSAGELRSALDRKDGKPSLLIVKRQNTTLFLTLRAQD